MEIQYVIINFILVVAIVVIAGKKTIKSIFSTRLNRINKELEEIMELEAAQGNQKAADYKKILSDPDKILDIFKLANLENKYSICNFNSYFL